MEDEDPEEDWYEAREQYLSEQWLDPGAARRQAAWLFLAIVAILVGTLILLIVTWTLYEFVFVPGAPPPER